MLWEKDLAEKMKKEFCKNDILTLDHKESEIALITSQFKKLVDTGNITKIEDIFRSANAPN